jgi:hypothetical protein
MKINKKVQCNHCQSVIEENGSCNCGKIKMVQGTITEGNHGIDYIDVSAQLLNEVA